MSEFDNTGSLGIEDKQDHPQRVKDLAGTETKYYFSAAELDKMRRATEELFKTKASNEAIAAAGNGFILFANEAAANTFFTNTPPAEDVLFKYTDPGASKAEFYRRASDNTTQLLKEEGLTNADTTDTIDGNQGNKVVESDAVALYSEPKNAQSINREIIIDVNGDKVEFIDPDGNVFFSVDTTEILGLKAIFQELTADQLTIIGQIIADNLKSNFIVSDNSKFEILDPSGNIMLHLSVDEGFKVIGQSSGAYTGLTGQNFHGIGDSLSTPQNFEQDFADATGAIFKSNFSSGGTNSIPNGGTSTQDRAKQYIDSTDEKDFVLIENVNDDYQAVASHVGDITELPFFISQYSIFENDFATKAAAEAYWDSNFNDVIATVGSQIKGTCIRLAFDTNKEIITVNSPATSDGTIVINVGGTTYSTDISNGDTANEIAAKLAITDYNGYSNSVSGNVLTLTQDEEGAGALSINSNNTGAGLTLTQGSTTGYVNRYFMGTTSGEFSNSANWQDYLSLYSSYKGIIEAISASEPAVKIYWWIPTKFNLVWNPATPGYSAGRMMADGTTFNMNVLKNTSEFVRYQALVDLQKEVCEYYGIKYADLHTKSNINPFNIADYYNENNVHPKRLTYTVWANEATQQLT